MFKAVLVSMVSVYSLSTLAATAQIKVIYGDDNRDDVSHVSNEMYLRLAKSTAGMVPNHKLKQLENDEVLLEAETLAQAGVCAYERFAAQPTAANCSGFLVGPKLLVTAGHCVTSETSCKNNSWVFDYKTDYSTQSEVIVENDDVYKCSKIVSRSLDSTTQNDYAVIELDREVSDRESLELRRDGVPSEGDKLVVIGHPSGLPTKVTDGGVVRSVNDVYMVTNLDTYGGNSGSAVFNSETGVVEGILVRGETDYVWDSSQGCRVSNVVASDAGRGEDVTLIKTVLDFVPKLEVPEPEPEEPTEEPTEPAEPTEPTEPEVPAWWQRFLDWLANRNR